ncbi:MAG: cytochrome-c oxidase, cbb3-type subunit III [Alphaproteobacteria bacterium]|nr:cytochrome-c oxidase, cbb3-type subunit III [Alphaproteobacteria bacterium]
MSGSKKDIDQVSGYETTGHEWDGIKELNRPLPRWWVWIFYATIVWSIGYMIFMPAIPGLPGMAGATPGLRNHSERTNVAEALSAAEAARGPLFAKLAGASLGSVENDPELLQFALAAGRSAFGDNCATCHGSGAQGFKGYPNLNDDVWLWGGGLSDIKQTLLYGIRSGHPDTRQSDMPAFGRDGILSGAEIHAVVNHVLALSGQEADAAAAAGGRAIFAAQCASCHGEAGKGLREFGAPNLTDAEWLYGGDYETLRETVTNSRRGVMPYWADRLDEGTIDALAIYVHTLGGGEGS